MRARIEQGRYADVAYRVVRMTQTCVACHSQLPSEDDASAFDLGFTKIDTEAWAPLQRAQLSVATGQYDLSLDQYEALLLDASEKPVELEASGALAEYLMIALRVRRDADRARKTLERFAKRPDVSPELERWVPRWTAAIAELEPVLSQESPPSLDVARRVLESGAALEDAPAARDDLVHRIVASSLLYRLIAERAQNRAELAEALLLLGETDAFIRRSFERSEAQFYLEQAIRLQPGSEVARAAYARL